MPPSPRTALVYDPFCEEHDTGSAHPERHDRLQWIVEALAEAGLNDSFAWMRPEPVALEWVERVHRPEYVRFLEQACREGRRVADTGDTLLCPDSFDVARVATGSAILAVDAVLDGRVANAFSLARPPGHHARPGAAMGFCLFNHIAVAARYAQVAHGLERIAILDWDVHHGNGTQEIFYADPSVHFTSFHQAPYYPFTGSREERGMDAGLGATLNFPLPVGARLDAFAQAWESTILPTWRAFQPELILISAGFDAHHRDPLAQLALESEDFGQLTDWVLAAAEDLCGGRVVSILEGGYDRVGLASSAVAHLRRLAGIPSDV